MASVLSSAMGICMLTLTFTLTVLWPGMCRMDLDEAAGVLAAITSINAASDALILAYFMR
jgi:hypothetical protein